jgi:hypothetical protein
MQYPKCGSSYYYASSEWSNGDIRECVECKTMYSAEQSQAVANLQRQLEATQTAIHEFLQVHDNQQGSVDKLRKWSGPIPEPEEL